MISVAIMAHPSREAFIPQLLASLDRPAEVVWDQIQNRWDTGRRSMLAYNPNATHHLVLQDDSIPCRDLVAGLEQAVAHVPEGVPLGLYIGTVRPYPRAVSKLVEATESETAWIVMNSLYWGVGVVVPTCHIDTMVAWCDQRTKVANYDLRMSAWFEKERIPVWYPWPSLVEHRDSPSLIPGRNSNRHARRFIGADASALDANWAGTSMNIGSLNGRRVVERAHYREITTGRVRRIEVSSPAGQRLVASGRFEQVRESRCPTCQHRVYVPVEEAEVV